MIQFIIILLKFNIAIMALWLFYVLLLERLTFFVSARFFFLAGIIVSAFISLVQFEWFDSLFTGQPDGGDLGQYMPSLHTLAHDEFHITTILLVAYVMGSVLFMGNLLIQYLSFLKLKKQARLTEMNGEKIYVARKDILPFSFGNAVFVSEKVISHPEIGKILSHEFIHIRQKHSIDIFIAELVRIAGWFNPFAWLLKKAINQNLEFLTDAALINNGIDKKSYQYLLLHFSGNRSFSLVTNFNFYSLKTRINKMNQNKSNRLQYSRFLLFIPVILVLVFVFSCMNEQTTVDEPKPKKMNEIGLEKLKLKLKEPVLELKLDDQNEKRPKQVLQLKKADSKLYATKLDIMEQSQAEQTLQLKEVEIELLPPPPPPVPAKE